MHPSESPVFSGDLASLPHLTLHFGLWHVHPAIRMQTLLQGSVRKTTKLTIVAAKARVSVAVYTNTKDLLNRWDNFFP